MPTPMPSEDDIRQKCEAFLQSLGVPAFLVFGWEKEEGEYGMVSSYHEMPANAVVKGMTWALTDIVNKTM